MTDRMRVAFFEPESDGHRWEHVRHLLASLVEKDHGIAGTFVLHSTLATKAVDFLAQRRNEDRAISVVSLPAEESAALTCKPLWRRALRRWKAMNKYSLSLRVAHWHYLYLDHMQLPLALGLHVEEGRTVSGLLFRPSIYYRSEEHTSELQSPTNLV